MSLGCKTQIVTFDDPTVTFNSSRATFNGVRDNVSGAGLDYKKLDFTPVVPKETDYKLTDYAPSIPVDIANGKSDDNCEEVCPIE